MGGMLAVGTSMARRCDLMSSIEILITPTSAQQNVRSARSAETEQKTTHTHSIKRRSLRKSDELVDIRWHHQVLMQGGMNPDLSLSWYIDLLQQFKERYPQVHVHAFSPPEFIEFVHFFDPPGCHTQRQINARHVTAA